MQERLTGAMVGILLVAMAYGLHTLYAGWAIAFVFVAALGWIFGGYTRHLRRLAERDHMTGANNRRPFERMLKREWAASLKKGTPMALIFLDIDDFGLINKRYGHLMGDEVLRGLTRLIRQNIRRSDLMARWGGEEFVVLLPHTNVAEAVVIAERIRSVVEQGVVRDRDRVIAVTVSTGVAVHPGRAASGQDLLREAIEAQLVAKKQKNVVEVVS